MESGRRVRTPLEYNSRVDKLRGREYPMLKSTVYLDHAGTTLIAKSLTERFASDLASNLYGNPHSASSCSQATRRRIDDVRMRLMHFFKASPEHFDLVFVANATAGVKLVKDAFQGVPGGFWYGYHSDCHTSLVGVREGAASSDMFVSDADVDNWVDNGCTRASNLHTTAPQLFAYPAQSNMNGRRLPLSWCRRIREGSKSRPARTYSLLDAAAYVSTSPLDLSDEASAPDFTVLSLYKIFGFPDLGALIVRKEAGGIFDNRKYFGGGTVDMVLAWKEQWHARKTDPLHEQLEDGTLPIHSIIALAHAMDVHAELFGTMDRVSRHVASLSAQLYHDMARLKHANGVTVCQIYKDQRSSFERPASQGPIVAFNIRNKHGAWISNAEIEKLAAVRDIQLRTGGLCNPAGIAMALDLEPWEMRQNFSAGQRCGNEFGSDIMNGKPTGMIRVSLGAMSTTADIQNFVGFLDEFFVDRSLDIPRSLSPASVTSLCSSSTTSDNKIQPPNTFRVESITIYPIKSCRGWQVPGRWPIRTSGFAWDREWCLVHEGTFKALSQKSFPKMALLQPEVDLELGLLRVRCDDALLPNWAGPNEVSVPLSDDPKYFREAGVQQNSPQPKLLTVKVMGERVDVRVYRSAKISDFFSRVVGSRCQLARFPPPPASPHVIAAAPDGESSSAHVSEKRTTGVFPGAWPEAETSGRRTGSGIDDNAGLTGQASRLSLANESPILIVSRSSLNKLNEDIRIGGGSHVAEIEVFRANIVLAQAAAEGVQGDAQADPYVEDDWKMLRIGNAYFGMAGPCRRCQMICIDPRSGERRQEPYATLAKRRRIGGRVLFGQLAFHLEILGSQSAEAQNPTIAAGDVVAPFYEAPRLLEQ